MWSTLFSFKNVLAPLFSHFFSVVGCLDGPEPVFEKSAQRRLHFTPAFGLEKTSKEVPAEYSFPVNGSQNLPVTVIGLGLGRFTNPPATSCWSSRDNEASVELLTPSNGRLDFLEVDLDEDASCAAAFSGHFLTLSKLDLNDASRHVESTSSFNIKCNIGMCLGLLYIGPAADSLNLYIQVHFDSLHFYKIALPEPNSSSVKGISLKVPLTEWPPILASASTKFPRFIRLFSERAIEIIRNSTHDTQVLVRTAQDAAASHRRRGISALSLTLGVIVVAILILKKSKKTR